MLNKKDYTTILTLLKDRKFKLETGNLNYSTSYIKHELDNLNSLITKTEDFIHYFINKKENEYYVKN